MKVRPAPIVTPWTILRCGRQFELFLVDRRLLQQLRRRALLRRLPDLLSPVASEAHQRIGRCQKCHLVLLDL
jgi:hypothetical protein